MKRRCLLPATVAALALAAACADPAAERDENTGTLLENATPPPTVDATNDASTTAPATAPVLPQDYGTTGPAVTTPSRESAATTADNGPVQMRVDSAQPVGPIP